MAEQIGVYHLAQNPELFEIQRNNTFEFVVNGLNGVQRAWSLPGEGAIANAEEVIRLSVTKAAVPHFEQAVVEVKRGNNTMKFAGVPTYAAGDFEFHDFIGADTKAALMAWQNMSYNAETEKVGALARSPYKKTCNLIEYAPDFVPVRTWTLYGCWISKLQEGQYSSEDGGKHLITATIQYDYAKLDKAE